MVIGCIGINVQVLNKRLRRQSKQPKAYNAMILHKIPSFPSRPLAPCSPPSSTILCPVWQSLMIFPGPILGPRGTVVPRFRFGCPWRWADGGVQAGVADGSPCCPFCLASPWLAVLAASETSSPSTRCGRFLPGTSRRSRNGVGMALVGSARHVACRITGQSM